LTADSRRLRYRTSDVPTPSRQWLEIHHILLNRQTEAVLVEALTNVNAVPDTFTFIGLPLNIPGCDGSPIRAVAMF
jgi:arylformamidase